MSYSKDTMERFALLFACGFIAFGGYFGSLADLSLNTFLGAIVAAVFIMGWVITSTIAGGLETLRKSLEELKSSPRKQG